jgi:8-oxo-dGTP diphosphatase
MHANGAEVVVDRIRVVAAVIEREGKLLVCQRPRHKRHGGLWEFPGGKLEPGEDDLAAVRRELREELDIEALSVAEECFRMDDDGSHFTIVFVPTVIAGTPRPLEHEAIMWADAEDLSRLDLAPSDRHYVAFRASEASKVQDRP